MDLYKTAQQVGKATIAVEARGGGGTEDTSRCCRGGESGRRYRVDGLSASEWSSLSAREQALQEASKSLVQK